MRAVIVAASETNQQLYPSIAASTSGATRSDAQRVAAFLPRSRAVVLDSANLDAYLNNVDRLPGDAEVKAAAVRVYADLGRSCRGVETPQSSTPASPVTVIFDVKYVSGDSGRAHVFYNDPSGIPVVLDVSTPWASPPIEYAGTGHLLLVASTLPRSDTNFECDATTNQGKTGRAAGFSGVSSCEIDDSLSALGRSG